MVKSTVVKPSSTSSLNNKPATATTSKKNTTIPTKTSDKSTPKPVARDPPKPVEVNPSKPVKEASKAIDNQIMKEQKEKAAQKDVVKSLKSNENKPATKQSTTGPIASPKKDEKNVIFAWTPTGAENVQITGSFNNWQERLDMKPVGDKHELSIPLKPGKYSYKFIVDGQWCYDFTAPNETDPDGNVNNIITV